MSSDHYFRPACKLRGVEEEETSNILTPMDDTDTKRACIIRRHRDTHLLDNSHLVHTELPTNESHLMPAKRPYTCSTESQSSNGFDPVACEMKMCTYVSIFRFIYLRFVVVSLNRSPAVMIISHWFNDH